MRAPALIATCVLLMLSPAAGTADTAPTTLADCDRRVGEAPEEFESYSCYWLVARNQGLLNQAARHLDEMLELDPGNQRIQLYLGIILADLGQARAESLIRRAAEGFAAEGNARGEIYARVSLSIFYGHRGRTAEARRELEAGLESALDAGDPDLEAQVRIHLAWQHYHERRYGQAWEHLERLEHVVFPDGSIYHRLDTLDALAAVSWALGRHRAALDHYRRALDLLQGADPYRESNFRRNMALVAQGLAAEGSISLEALIALKRDALDAAIRSGNPLAEAGARLTLANSLDDEEGLEQTRQGLAVARETGKINDICLALWLLAEKSHKLDSDRGARAFAFVNEALELASSRGDAELFAMGSVVRAKMRWDGGPRRQAIADTFVALDAVERIRDLQPEGEFRARVFARFADDYRWLANSMLRPDDGEPSAEAIERALQIVERMRARSLLDTLDAAGATAMLLPSSALVEERAAMLDAIADIRRRLGRTSLTPEARQALLGELSRAEQSESSLRDDVVREFPRYAAILGTALASVADVQDALRPDQAMLSFQTLEIVDEPDAVPGSDSWALVITDKRVDAIPLPGCGGLDRRIRLFLSLIERRDGSERKGAEQLYRDLLAVPLRRLPAGARSLIVIPDGPLHRLPFGALVEPSDDRPLGARFEISIAPSASAWLRLTRTSTAEAPYPLLALADPALPPVEGAGGPRWRELLGAGEALQPLPGARREAMNMQRHAGPTGRVLTGSAATEAALKNHRLSDFRMIHLAAHAVVNDEYPERSAVVLATETDKDDGLLAFREVVDLDMDGQVVLLSSCRSAAGPLIGGEGLMGLANAFFQAGARSVVAGLWRVRDRETASLIDRFGRYLGQGRSVASSMALARRDLIRGGAPTAAWAGMVVLGDGGLTPFAGHHGQARSWPRGPTLFAAMLVVAIAVVFYRRIRAGR